MSFRLDFRTPVVCQNGHKAFWYWYIKGNEMTDFGEATQVGVVGDRCSCPKQGLGEGYVRAGNDQISTGWFDRATQQEIYSGDIVVAPYHWSEWHIIELPEDFYDVSEFVLTDCLSICGNVFTHPEMARVASNYGTTSRVGG